MGHRSGRKVMRQAFDIVRAAPRIDGLAGPSFLLQHDLSVARNTSGKIGRQGERFIKTVRVQRLGLSARRRDAFKAGADNIIVNILRGERPTRGLTMGAQG